MSPPRTRILSEFMALTNPSLPERAPVFLSIDLMYATGVTRKSIEDWLKSGILRASINHGSPGRSDNNSHKFSERDLLVAACICSLPTMGASEERRNVSDALYAAPALHRYILITKTSARLFDSLNAFVDPEEWPDAILNIIDLRKLWSQMEKRCEKKIVGWRPSVSKLLKVEDSFSGMKIPTGENAKRIGR